MPVCVECAQPVPSLYTEYGKGNICLTQCGKCEKFADKYIEFDNVVLFIDMLLHKPQVYRHLLFNVLSTSSASSGGHSAAHSRWGWIGRLGTGPLPWSVIKLCALLIFFEVYIKWANLEKSIRIAVESNKTQFMSQYLFLLGISVSELAVYQMLARAGCILFLGWNEVTLKMDSVIAGLILSSFGKFLHIVMIIWDYHDMEFEFLINLIVFTSNLEALSAIFSISYPKSALILGIAMLGKYAFQILVKSLNSKIPYILL